MQKYRNFYYPLRISSDLVILVFSFFLSSFVAKKRIFPDQRFFSFERREIYLLIALCLVWYFSTKMTNLYDEFRSQALNYELVCVFKNCFVQLVAAIIALFFIKTLILSRFFIVLYFFVLFIFLSHWKIVFRVLLRWALKKGFNLCSILIIGAGKVGQEFFNAVKSIPHLGFRVVGFLDPGDSSFLGSLYLGSLDELPKILSQKNVDEVVIALPNEAVDKIDQVISICEDHTVPVRIIPDVLTLLSPRLSVSLFGNFPVFSVRMNPLEEVQWRILKRSFDLALAVFLFLFVFSWLWPLVAIAVKLDSRGPAFFKQERWGRKNKRIICYKFRTMFLGSKEVDEHGRYLPTRKNDPRVTRIGKFLRRINLDELSQFLNVLKGEMSVVGPRPHPTPLNIEAKDRIRHYMLRHLVKPGITGWAQVNGFRGEPLDSLLMEKRIEHDLWYIENWSFWLDLQIIFITLMQMLRGHPQAY